jgi:hypothetical protein
MLYTSAIYDSDGNYKNSQVYDIEIYYLLDTIVLSK